MKLRNYCLVVLMGMLWSTGAMAGTVNINLAEVGELADRALRPHRAIAVV